MGSTIPDNGSSVALIGYTSVLLSRVWCFSPLDVYPLPVVSESYHLPFPCYGFACRPCSQPQPLMLFVASRAFQLHDVEQRSVVSRSLRHAQIVLHSPTSLRNTAGVKLHYISAYLYGEQTGGVVSSGQRSLLRDPLLAYPASAHIKPIDFQQDW